MRTSSFGLGMSRLTPGSGGWSMTLGAALLSGAVAVASGCQKTEESGAGGGGGAGQASDTPVAVTGTLALDSSEEGTADLANREVELVADDQTVVANGRSDATGAFTIALPTDGGGLRLSGSGGTRVVTLRTIFLNGEATPSALGVRKQIVIDARDAAEVKDGVAMLATGTHAAKRVGAIVGRVTLESNEDPTGIDVYVPGTSNIAKTDADGLFILGFLPPGTYSVRADRRGFAPQEWADIVVAANATTTLPDTVMPVATGPKVVKATLEDGGLTAFDADATLKLELKAASKFRVSLYEDYRDTVFRAYDARSTVALVPLRLGNLDGLYTVHIEAADADGLSVSTTLEILLDTAPPAVPLFAVRTSGAKDGFAASTAARLFVKSCDDTTAIYAREAASEESPPAVADIAFSCADALDGSGAGMPITLSADDGVKELIVWTKDAAGQRSPVPRHGAVTLDTVAPTLSVSPACAAYGTAIRMVPTASDDATVYYQTNLTAPDVNSPVVPGELAIFSEITLKLRAIDGAGNASAVLTCQYDIDRDGPILGTIAVDDDDGLLGTTAVPLDLSAIGATKMALAESPAALVNATPVAFAEDYAYTLVDTDDGSHTIYVKFLDDAGNAIGENGELNVTVTLDRTAPAAAAIALLTPASPASDFDKLLAWSSALSDVTYEVEVYKYEDGDGAFDHKVRPAVGDDAMTTTATSISVAPALDEAGTYYWRVRAIDTAGNVSSWVEASAAQAFVLTELASAFTARKKYQGRNEQTPPPEPRPSGMPPEGRLQDYFLGRDLIELGDINGSGGLSLGSEVAWSQLGTLTYVDSAAGGTQLFRSGVCEGCGAVFVRDLENDRQLFRIQEDGTPRTLYGQRMIACDLIPGGAKELVVAAPGYPQLTERTPPVGGYPPGSVPPAPVIWPNAGAVFVYSFSGGTVTRVAKLVNDVAGSAYYDNCETTWCPSGGGPELPVAALDYMPPREWRNAALLGWSLACEPDGAGDRLWVGEPGYAPTPVAPDPLSINGRMRRFALSGGQLVAAGAGVAPSGTRTGFGVSALYLPDFEFGACDGPTLAVGAPYGGGISGATGKGLVDLFHKNGSTWEACDTIDYPAAAPWPMVNTFGLGLFDLGDVTGTGQGSKLAVAEPGLADNAACGGAGTASSYAGPVRIYGDNDPDPIAAARFTASSACPGTSYGRFGHHVAFVGDLSDDGEGDVGIGVPHFNPNQRERGGAILAYKWADLVTMKAEGASPVAPGRVFSGAPENGSLFGARFFVRPDEDDGYDAEPAELVASRPGWGVSNNVVAPANNGTHDVAMPNRGRVEIYASSRLKFGQPSRLTGSLAEAGFGATVLSVPDADGDGIADLLVGQPKGRCGNLDWGSVSLISGADSRELRALCGPHNDSRFGSLLLVQPDSARVLIGYQGAGSSAKLSMLGRVFGTPEAQARPTLLDPVEFLAPTVPETTTIIRTGVVDAKFESSSVPVIARGMAMAEQVYVGNTATTGGLRFGSVFRYLAGSPTGNNENQASSIDLNDFREVRGPATSEDFGASVAVLKYVDASMGAPMEKRALAVGAPGGDAVYGGVDQCFSGSGAATDLDACPEDWSVKVSTCTVGLVTSPCLKFYFDGGLRPVLDNTLAAVSDGVLLTSSLEENFGAHVVALPDLDGVDQKSQPGPPIVPMVDTYDVWLAVSNVGPRDSGAQGRTPQVHIIGINVVTPDFLMAGPDAPLPPVKLLTTLEGERGTGLGVYMTVFEDLDGDLKPELAIAEPWGTGLYGATGQLRIYSVGKIFTPVVDVDPLIQVIFNPATEANNFGVAMLQADTNGDDYKDILVGADRFSFSSLANVGALYIFPIEAVAN